MIDRGDLSEKAIDEVERGLVLLRRIGGRAVGHNHGVVIPHERLPRGGLDTDVGGDAGQHNGPDAMGSQDHVEVGAVEGAVAMLGDDDVLRGRPDIAVILAAARAFLANRRQSIAAALPARRLLQPDVRQVPIVFGRIGATHEHHQNPGLARMLDKFRQPLRHLLDMRDVAAALRHEAVARAKIILHVDHDQCCVRHSHLLPQRRQRRDMRDAACGRQARRFSMVSHQCSLVARMALLSPSASFSFFPCAASM